jgi:thioredoxin-like negative regulator of GroEL
MKTKHVLFVIAVVVILYLIYQHNKKDEKMTNDITVKPVVQSAQVPASNSAPVLGVYYTEWCGYSQQFVDQLNNGVGEAIEKAGAKVKLVDCEKDKETCAKYDVQGFPTLLLHTSKGVVPYNGHRSGEAIAEFIAQNK